MATLSSKLSNPRAPMWRETTSENCKTTPPPELGESERKKNKKTNYDRLRNETARKEYLGQIDEKKKEHLEEDVNKEERKEQKDELPLS